MRPGRRRFQGDIVFVSGGSSGGGEIQLSATAPSFTRYRDGRRGRPSVRRFVFRGWWVRAPPLPGRMRRKKKTNAAYPPFTEWHYRKAIADRRGSPSFLRINTKD